MTPAEQKALADKAAAMESAVDVLTQECAAYRGALLDFQAWASRRSLDAAASPALQWELGTQAGRMAKLLKTRGARA
jgi:hypothetical protein